MYVNNVVWYAPAVTARRTSTALWRKSTNPPVSSILLPAHRVFPTVFPIPDYIIEGSDKVCEDWVDMIEAGQDGYDIGA